MGWAGGSELATELWDLVREYIPASKKKKIARKFVDAFENEDCDTMGECEDLLEDAGISWDDDGNRVLT